MEYNVFPQPAVAGELEPYFVEARLHSDAHDPVQRKRIATLIEEVAQSSAQPIYVVIDPTTGRELGRRAGATLKDISPFIEFLQQARQQVEVAAID